MNRALLLWLAIGTVAYGQSYPVKVDKDGDILHALLVHSTNNPNGVVNFETGKLLVNGVPVGGGGTGTVTSVAVTGSDGVSISGSPITTSGTINVSLGNITPDSVNASGTVTGSNLSGTNTGDQDLSGLVPNTRAINTTSPLSGGGNLSADRTLSIGNAAADGATKGAAAFLAADFDAALGVISIDYANGQAATSSAKGFLTAADWTTFNNKGNGTVTSVGITPQDGIGVSGSPITSSGNFTLSLGNITPDSVAIGTGTALAPLHIQGTGELFRLANAAGTDFLSMQMGAGAVFFNVTASVSGAEYVFQGSYGLQAPTQSYGSWAGSDLLATQGAIQEALDGLHRLSPPTGTTIASSSTLDLTGQTSYVLEVTGSTTITSIIIPDGEEHQLRFVSGLTIENSGSLQLQGGDDLIAEAGSWIIVQGKPSSVTRQIQYVTEEGYSRETFDGIYMNPFANIGWASFGSPSFTIGKYAGSGNTGSYIQIEREGNFSLYNNDSDLFSGASIDTSLLTTVKTFRFPNTGGRFAIDAHENVFTAKQTIDTGDNGDTETDGLVMRNDTPADTGTPQQDAPLIVFEANGIDGFDTNHEHEMNEKFFVVVPGDGLQSKFSWEWSVDGGPYEEKVYISSNGDVGAVGGYCKATLGFEDTGAGGFFSGTFMQINSSNATMLRNANTTAPFRFTTSNTTVSAYHFLGNTLTTGSLIDGIVTDTGFTGSLLRLGNTSNGLTLTTTDYDFTRTGGLKIRAISAPSTPASGLGAVYVDSTSKNIAVKDDAGVVKHGVKTKASVSNSFVTAIDDDGSVTVAQPTEANLSTSDITTNNVTSTKHGFAPKSPADATKFLNGAATPDYAAVKDSDLSTSDITTNDVSTSKHGFAPKAPNDTTKFLDGTAAWQVLPLIRLKATSVSVLTTGTPADIATISIPAGITRWRTVATATTACLSGYYLESGAGTLAGANFSAFDTSGGGGVQMMASSAGPNTSPWTPWGSQNNNTSVSTTSNLYIRQTSNSANSGVLSFFVWIEPIF